MKKNTSIYTLGVFLIAAAVLTYGQSIDLSGTWMGETEIPDAFEPDEVTLILIKENGEYSGKVSDTMGMFDETDCEDIEFSDNKLTYNILAQTENGAMRIFVSMIVDGDTMAGQWEAEDGSTGEVTMEKK
jgi:hypothetical protein